MPILFEWYKFVAQMCIFYALIERDSPAVRDVPPIQYAVITGLLNRCARLMLSNIALSHNGRFGETTSLLDRCIFESCLKVEWLCYKRSEESFKRYLADGLKTEIELMAEIKGEIANREKGQTLNIEKRMLKSIKRHMDLAGLSEEEIKKIKKLPDTAAMIEELGYQRLTYVVVQRIGSHHVHGTWSSLLLHYLEEKEGGKLVLKDHDCDTHPNQFVMLMFWVIKAMSAFIGFIFEDEEDIMSMHKLLESIREEIQKINSEMSEGDFDAVM